MHATKHEGAGNDFLVVLDPDDTIRFSVAQVRLLADRRRGIGADGIIRVGPGRDGCDLSMQLHNADGGEAEMSGNGMRCLAQAAVDAGLVAPPRFSVWTAGGPRSVSYTPGESPGWAKASVDMGPATLGPDQPQEFEDRRARTVDVGNPHLVLLGPDTAAVDIAELGPKLQAAFTRRDQRRVDHGGARSQGRAPRPPGVGARGRGDAGLRHRECRRGRRGAQLGMPRAPGPSACAIRAATLEVTLGADERDTAYLAGPVRKVADIEIHPGMLS